MKTFKISVIIPCFNAQETIIPCLESLLNQSLKPFEVIIVDDGSTDSSFTLLSKFIIHHFLFAIHRLPHQGVASARNSGAKIAKGEILAFTDSDCQPHPGWLKNINLAFNNPGVGAVGGGYNSGINQSFWQRFSFLELNYRQKDRPKEVSTLLSNNFACLKTAFFKAKGFPEKYKYGEDMLLSYQISRFSKLLWLKNNGVKHSFRHSLISYLKHQYATGRGSILFFLENPSLLLTNHYQGKKLHFTIALAFFATTTLFLSFYCQSLFLLFLAFWVLHLFLYLPFLLFLKQKKSSFPFILQSYSVSTLRDFVCVFALFEGFLAYVKNKV